MATQPSKPLRLSHGPTQVSGVNTEQGAKLRTNGVYYMDDQLVTVGAFTPNNWGYVDIPIGPYTYRQFGISIVAPAAIVGKTDASGARNGVHIVTTAAITDYVDQIVLEINGAAKWSMTAAQLAAYNAYHNHDTADGVLRMVFGSPGLFGYNDMIEDAYQFGTGNLRSAKLRIKTKAAWVTGMMPVITTEYAPVSRPLGYFQTTTETVVTNPGAGEFSITDIAVGIDFAALWVQAPGIKRAKLTVDRREVFDLSAWNLRALHTAWGKDYDGLGEGIMFDAWRDGDGIGLDSVSDSVAERRRGADVRLDLQMAAANTTIKVTVLHCGLFSQQ